MANVKAIRGIANPLGTMDRHKTVIQSIKNNGGGVKILNRHKEQIGEGFIHLEEGNVMLTGFVREGEYQGDLESAGLSIGWNPLNMKCREADGVAYYSDVVIDEVSLTPMPSNPNAKVLMTREAEGEEVNEENQNKEGEPNQMAEMNEQFMAVVGELANEKAEKQQLADKVRELEEAQAELKKQREAQITENAEDAQEKFMRELGEKMAEMPEKGFLREFTNAKDLAVSNQLGSLVTQWAHKSSLFSNATKARFQGLTLADDGDDGLFKAKLFVAGEDKKKALTPTKRSLRPQMAYAYMEMDKATVSGVNDTGELSKYVMGIMPQKVLSQIEFNMIYGANDGSNGIYGLKGDTTDKWVPQVEYDLAQTDLFEVLTDGVARIAYNDNLVMVMHPLTYAEIRKAKGSDGHSRFNELATKQEIANSFGAVDIQTRAWMTEGDIAIYNQAEFVLIGNLDMNNYTDFDLRYNVDQWLAEMLVGGSIRGRGRAVFLTKKAGE